jgi:membrane-associated phospholipid phosphatase
MLFFNQKLNHHEIVFQVLKFYLFAFLSRFINIQIKLFFKRKRPYVTHKSIKVLEKAKEKKKNTYSFPSNSIQTSLIFYGFMLKTMGLSLCFNNIILTLIVLITSFAKINRGMHYPSDILFSVIIYYILLVIYNCYLNYIIDFINNR